MAKKYYEEQYINNTAIAIKNKLPNAGTFKVREFAGLINDMATLEVESKDINFYDYDGRRLYAYTLEEIQLLEELPPLPSHVGLTCQGWNWTLPQIKAARCPLEVGSLFITTDGATKLFIEIPDDNYTFYLRFRTTTAQAADIDWGDGSQKTVSNDSTDYQAYQHIYENKGPYTISVSFNSSATNSTNVLFGYNFSSDAVNNRPIIGDDISGDMPDPSKDTLKKMYFAQRMGPARFCFFYCGIECFTTPAEWFPYSPTLHFRDNWNKFSNAYKLKILTIPNEIDVNDNSVFSNLWGLKIFSAGYGIGISYDTFGGTASLSNLKIYMCCPNSSGRTISVSNSMVIEKISVLHNCIYMDPDVIQQNYNQYKHVKEVYMLAQTQVPTFSAVSMNPFMKIYVPASLYEDWIAASGWSDYAEQIIPVVL